MKTALQINLQVVLALILTFLMIQMARVFSSSGPAGNPDGNISGFAGISPVLAPKHGKLNPGQQSSGAIVKVTRYPLKSGSADALHNALAAYVVSAEGQKSNLMAEAYYERENPNVLWLIERWTTQDGYTNFLKTGSYKTLAALVPQLTDGPTEMTTYRDLEPLSRSAWRKQPSPLDKPFTVMLFVDAKSGTEDEFIKRYHKAMPKFRGEKGVVTYGLSQNTEDQTKFITYEKFRGEEAFQYHLKFEPVKPVLDFLDHSIKSPPFQKEIHNLILISPES